MNGRDDADDQLGATLRATIRTGRLDALDGLRAVAVVGVLLSHVPYGPSFGGGGVDVFFVLSGYLITRLLLGGDYGFGRAALREFYVRRVRRLAPELLFALILVAPFSRIVFPVEGFRDFLICVAGALTFTSNVLLARLGAERVGGLAPLWSLAVEEQFYAVWPLCFVLVRMRSRRHAHTVLWSLVALAVCFSLVVRGIFLIRFAAYVNPVLRADGIGLGALLAFTLRASSSKLPERKQVGQDTTRKARIIERSPIIGAFQCALLGALLAMMYLLPTRPDFLFRFGIPLVELAAVALIAAIVISPGASGSRLLSWRVATWIGHRSFSVYLLHFPVIFVLRSQLDEGRTIAVLALLITLPLSGLSFWTRHVLLAAFDRNRARRSTAVET